MALYQEQVAIGKLSGWIGLSRSTYYYQSTTGKSGAKPSTVTLKRDRTVHTNEQVVTDIRSILSEEFSSSWGYEITAAMLRNDTFQYIINKKKVYRLMKESKLLLNRKMSPAEPRKFVSFRTIEASYPMEYLCMDIKYVWIEGERRNCYLLTVLDVYSRKALDWIFQPSIHKKDVVALLKRIDQRDIIKGVNIRNDNGPQFIAHLVKNFLRMAEVQQEFTHPATPEENAYIEAYHSILQREVIAQYEFASYYEAKTSIERYSNKYNQVRPHRSLKWFTPHAKWQQGLALRPAVKPQNEAQDELSRPMDTPEKTNSYPALDSSLDNSQGRAYLCLTAGRKGAIENQSMNLNQIEKSVQIIGG